MAFEPFVQFVRGIQGKINSAMFGGLHAQNIQHIAFIRQLQRDLTEKSEMTIPLGQLNVVVFDIETTGFFPDKGDQIISIGAIKILGGIIQEEQTFYSLVRFDSPLSSEIEELTGIISEQLREAPILSEVLIQFLHFVKGYPLVAHHANHEKIFMHHAFWTAFRTPFKHRVFDTSFLYRIAEPEEKLIRLEDFCEKNQIPVVDRHNALGDAKMTARLWNCYSQKVQKAGFKNMKEVYERLANF